MNNDIILTEFARVINSDRYQYTESDIFLMENMQNKIAVFDMFFRKTEDGGFAVVSGIQEVIHLIEVLNTTSEEEKRKYFSKVLEEEHLVDFLSKMKFTGDLYAIQDGEIVYPNEPIITIKAPLIQAKILETPILNIMNMNLGIATKASMVTRAADPVKVLAFGSRRAHGFDSAVQGNKAAIIGGCYGHSNLVTEYKYGIPSNGTMSHSYIQAFGVGAEAEKEAFVTFIKHRRQRKRNSLILLIDTYDTIHIGIENAIKAFKECVDEEPLIKISGDVIKISNPGFKEVYRIFDKDGYAYADLISLVKNDKDKEKLLNNEDFTIRDEKYDFKSSLIEKDKYTYTKLTKQYIKDGKIDKDLYDELFDIMKSQKHYFDSLAKVSVERKRLENPHSYKVDLSSDLIELKYGLINKIKNV